MRKIVIAGEIYFYKVGKTYLVVRFPQGGRRIISLSDLTGRDVERGRWKKNIGRRS